MMWNGCVSGAKHSLGKGLAAEQALYCRKQKTCHARLAVWRRKAAQQGCFLCTAVGQCEEESRGYRTTAGMPIFALGSTLSFKGGCGTTFFFWGTKP